MQLGNLSAGSGLHLGG